MDYKLFIFGTPGLFATVQIPYDMNIQVGSVFIYNEKRYKVLDIVRVAFDVLFNDKGARQYPVHDNNITEEQRFKSYPLPEMYITEVPKY